jgi:hypothetical protein
LPCTFPESEPFALLEEVFELWDLDDAELVWVVGEAAVDGAVVAGPAAVGAGVAPVVGVAAACGHDSDSERIGRLTGSDSCVNGVPAGTSMVNGI